MKKPVSGLAKACSVPTYAALRDKVRETLLDGMRRIEQERTRAYWQTGKYIQEHVLFHKERADYGRATVEKLSMELEIDATELWRMLQFAEKFPILGRGRELKWSHYRVLITIPDGKKMLALADRASEEAWTRDEIREAIKKEFGRTGPKASDVTPLAPKRGILGTYRLRGADEIGWPVPGVLFVDNGFRSYKALTPQEAGGLKAGDIVEISGGKLVKSARAEKDLYMYRAYFTKGIDGDTFWMTLDRGRGDVALQKLRLRGINCPELDAPEGVAAKKFVEAVLKAAASITVCSSKNDNHDRFEADVFFIDSKGREVYLNNLLLEKGHAVRMKE